MPYVKPDSPVTLFGPGLYTFTVTAPPLKLNTAGVRLFLNVTSIAGAGASLLVAIEEVDPLTGNGVELSAWQFPLVVATGTWELTIYPNIQTAANQAVNDCLHGDLLVSAFIGGTAPQVQFSLCAVPIG